jgi:hypothetical protein
MVLAAPPRHGLVCLASTAVRRPRIDDERGLPLGLAPLTQCPARPQPPAPRSPSDDPLLLLLLEHDVLFDRHEDPVPYCARWTGTLTMSMLGQIPFRSGSPHGARRDKSSRLRCHLLGGASRDGRVLTGSAPAGMASMNA